MGEVVARQTAALHILYQRYFHRAYGLALRIVQDPAAAEDCVHDSFLKLWQRPHLYDPDRGRFSSWFLTVIHHQARNYVRAAYRVQVASTAERSMDDLIPEEWSSAGGQARSAEDTVMAQETQRTMTAILADLHRDQRIVLELAYGRGMSHAQVAHHLGVPLGTVKTRIRSGMQRLRGTLEAQGWRLDDVYC